MQLIVSFFVTDNNQNISKPIQTILKEASAVHTHRTLSLSSPGMTAAIVHYPVWWLWGDISQTIKGTDVSVIDVV